MLYYNSSEAILIKLLTKNPPLHHSSQISCEAIIRLQNKTWNIAAHRPHWLLWKLGPSEKFTCNKVTSSQVCSKSIVGTLFVYKQLSLLTGQNLYSFRQAYHNQLISFHKTQLLICKPSKIFYLLNFCCQEGYTIITFSHRQRNSKLALFVDGDL